MSGTAATSYPILAQLRLQGPRGLVGRNRERLKDIPTERTGIGLVLDVDGVVHEVENGTPLRRAHGIGSASAVILVDLRRRRMKIDVTLPSREPHHDFSATATFHCQVRSAAAIVQEQVDDFTEALTGWTTNVLRRRSRSIRPESTAELEAIGRDLLSKATSRSPLLRATVIAIELASFEVNVSGQWREELLAAAARERAAKARIDQLRWDDRIDEQADIVESNRDDRQWVRRKRSSGEYEDALARGPEAMMALLLADDPSRIPEVLSRQLQDKAALYQFLIEVTRSPHIDGSVMEPYAKQLAELVGQQLRVGPGFASPGGLTEGSSWPAEGFGDGLPDDDGSAPPAEDDPFDPDAIMTGEVIETDASPPGVGSAETGGESPRGAASVDTPPAPPTGDAP